MSICRDKEVFELGRGHIKEANESDDVPRTHDGVKYREKGNHALTTIMMNFFRDFRIISKTNVHLAVMAGNRRQMSE